MNFEKLKQETEEAVKANREINNIIKSILIVGYSLGFLVILSLVALLVILLIKMMGSV